ncbi:MAG: RloB domain-containing protein, partial [Bacteroidaceae bacterium]|nr:RloB domain-containing protein [Bacteroidaceae bacterium]
DVAGMFEKLKCIPDTTLLVSNPCIELWFLLHCRSFKVECNQQSCVKAYKSYSEHYSKGKLGIKDMQILAVGESDAVIRAKGLCSPNNPSTSVYKLIEAIREA